MGDPDKSIPVIVHRKTPSSEHATSSGDMVTVSLLFRVDDILPETLARDWIVEFDHSIDSVPLLVSSLTISSKETFVVFLLILMEEISWNKIPLLFGKHDISSRSFPIVTGVVTKMLAKTGSEIEKESFIYFIIFSSKSGGIKEKNFVPFDKYT